MPLAGGWQRYLFLILIAAFVVTGLFGRDPWKADEPYSVGMALNFADSQDWIVPRVAGVPFVEKPPLMYWTAALAARAAQGWLPFFDGAQLAVLAWVGALLWLLARTARCMGGAESGLLACTLLLGTLGATEHLHKLTADVPFTVGAMMALAALVGFAAGRNPGATNGGARAAAELPSSAFGTGGLLGTGVGMAFMSKGLLVPGVVGLTCVAASLWPAFRNRCYLAMLGWALLGALPWLLIWPLLFWHTSHTLFIEWFWDNNFGRFFGFVHLGGARTGCADDVRSLIGLTFPAGWLATAGLLAGLRKGRWRTWLDDPVRGVLWLYVAVFVATLSASSSNRDVYMLPMMPALALLAAAVKLPARLDRLWALAALVLFSAVGVAIWLRWGAMVTGHGDVLTFGLGHVLPLDYPLQYSVAGVSAALAMTVLWVIAIVQCLRARIGALLTGFAGLAFAWGVLMSLLLPWLNEARSYRTAFTELRRALPQQYDCMTSYNVGESERAMLDLFAGIQPLPVQSVAQADACSVLLVLDKAAAPFAAPTGWALLWQGGRQGDTNERFRAFMRR